MKLHASLSKCAFSITIFTRHPNKFAKYTQKIDDEEITVLVTKADDSQVTLQLLTNKAHEFYSMHLPIKKEACFVYSITIAPTEKAKFPIGNAFWEREHLRETDELTCKGAFTAQFGSSMCKTKIHRSYSKQYARYKWHYIKFNGYVSKFSFDKFIHIYDCHCKLCKTGNWTSWVSNPDIGYVREVDYENNLGFFQNLKLRKEGIFFYHGKYYTPCKDNEYYRLFFMTRNVYDDERWKYRPRDPTNLDKNEWEKIVGSFTKEDFTRMNLDDLYKDNKLSFHYVYKAQYKKLGYYLIADEHGLYGANVPNPNETKVISPEYLSYSKEYPSFDVLLSHPLTQEEIDDNGNHVGGALREKETGKIVEYVEGYDTSRYDPVVSLGWHRTDIEGSIKCPCCEDLNEIIRRSDYVPLPVYQWLIEKFKWWLDEVKAKKEIKKNKAIEV